MARSRFVALAFLLAPVTALWAEQHTAGVPALSSRPGAAYTIYLDPAGFNYDGMWIGSTPGNNLGLNARLATDTFNADDVTQIRALFAAMANQYRSFNVNVTTVDPAIAAGQAATDLQRKNYYDSQPRMMHTVIGPPGNAGWQGAADGLAGLDVIQTVAPAGTGLHTNWMFSQDVDRGGPVEDGNYIGNISSHEAGHTFGLNHQGDFTGNTNINEYSDGDAAAGNGSYVPTMGNASARQRVAWRVGDVNADGNRVVQNDVAVILANSGMSFVDSGIGHTRQTATPLPLVNGSIDVSDPSHAGWISPASSSDPQPLAVANYTTDFFSFLSDGITPISLTLNDGNDLLTAGVADNGATFRGILNILDTNGFIVGSATEDVSTLFGTYSGLLGAGSYFAQITSYGGHAQISPGFNAANYFDMGGYFLTGSGFAIPEPGTFGVLFFGGLTLIARRRRTPR